MNTCGLLLIIGCPSDDVIMDQRHHILSLYTELELVSPFPQAGLIAFGHFRYSKCSN